MRSAPLYRSVNTRTHGVRHGDGGDFRHERNTKAVQATDVVRTSMHGRHHHGRDYTPLFRYLLSNVGKPWSEIYAEARARLDRTEPIFWLVARSDDERQDFVRVGESSYFSGLFVDREGLLQLVNPRLGPEDMTPACTCCTHTLNGRRFPVEGPPGQGRSTPERTP